MTNQSSALRPDSVIKRLASQNFQRLISDPKQECSKSEIAKLSNECKENAIRCLLLLLLARREISIDQTRQFLHHHIWSNYAQRCKDSADQLRVLLAAKQVSVLPAYISAEILEKLVTKQNYRLDTAQQAEARAIEKAKKLKQELEELRSEHRQSLKRARHINEELENQKIALTDERAHLQDEYERLRGTVLRRLKDELTLMEEGLHALQRDPSTCACHG